MKKIIYIVLGIIGIIFLIAVVAGLASPEGQKNFEAGMKQGKGEVEETVSNDKKVEEKEMDVINLRLNAYDISTHKKLDEEFEIWTKGKGSWYPDFTYGADNTILNGYSIGDIFEVFIYPNGRYGKEISFNILVDENTISESDRDAIMIEIEDTKIIVTSSGLEGKQKEFKF